MTLKNNILDARVAAVGDYADALEAGDAARATALQIRWRFHEPFCATCNRSTCNKCEMLAQALRLKESETK